MISCRLTKPVITLKETDEVVQKILSGEEYKGRKKSRSRSPNGNQQVNLQSARQNHNILNQPTLPNGHVAQMAVQLAQDQAIAYAQQMANIVQATQSNNGRSSDSVTFPTNPSVAENLALLQKGKLISQNMLTQFKAASTVSLPRRGSLLHEDQHSNNPSSTFVKSLNPNKRVSEDSLEILAEKHNQKEESNGLFEAPSTKIRRVETISDSPTTIENSASLR